MHTNTQPIPSSGVSRAVAPVAELRTKAILAQLGLPECIDRDPASPAIDIQVFSRNFIEDCDSESSDDEGYVLVTSGMSDQLMTAPPDSDPDATRALELIWYVRDLNPEYFVNLRWLAKLPFIDRICLVHGQTIAMPQPPLSFCPYSTFLLLPPIIRSDRTMFDEIQQQGHSIGTLAVHLVSPSEHQLLKSEDGLDQFLDLLDENDYPLIFDPARKPYVRP